MEKNSGTLTSLQQLAINWIIEQNYKAQLAQGGGNAVWLKDHKDRFTEISLESITVRPSAVRDLTEQYAREVLHNKPLPHKEPNGASPQHGLPSRPNTARGIDI